MAVWGLSLHQGSTESRKTLEQKFAFQIGTFYHHGINERDVSSSVSTVQLAKAKVITHRLTYAIAFSGRNFHVRQRKSLKIQTCSITIRRTLSS